MVIAEPRTRTLARGPAERRELAIAALRSDQPLDAFASAHDLTPQALRRLIRRELATRLPRVDGNLLGPVGRPVEVVRDRYGIPHVFAQSDHDAYFLVGWLHAQDRLFQMDQSRRQASGRLADGGITRTG